MSGSMEIMIIPSDFVCIWSNIDDKQKYERHDAITEMVEVIKFLSDCEPINKTILCYFYTIKKILEHIKKFFFIL